jgi:CDP-Glycerol:Poly(glycerophosphate) glycerophosphotransferase
MIAVTSTFGTMHTRQPKPGGSMTRRILVDARTPVHYTMFAPVHAVMAADPRVHFSFVASDDPQQAADIFRDAPNPRVIGPRRAAFERFDAYVASDFMWTPLLFKTCRIQMFHGVAGKYGFDAPTESLRAWQRLFFVNRRRLTNCVRAGALDADSPAIRLIGMPKVDRLLDGSLQRDAVLCSLGLPPDRPTVLYAPTWSGASSLNRLGVDLLGRLRSMPVNVIVKLHDRSLDLRTPYSGGVDWPRAIAPHLKAGACVLATSADVCPYLVAADVMITDHSSAGFEYLLRDRPLVRIHVPELIALAQVHPDYVRLLSEVSESTAGVDDTVDAVDRALADPGLRSAQRRAVAADLFHEPGTATARFVAALYEAVELPQPGRASGAARTDRGHTRQAEDESCRRSA